MKTETVQFALSPSATARFLMIAIPFLTLDTAISSRNRAAWPASAYNNENN
jgi:hypothetical protein